MKSWRKFLSQFDGKLCLYIVSIILPFSLLSLALSPHQESRCLYALIITGSYWILEPVPIYVSGLLPVVLLPLLGLLNSPEICANYMREVVMLVIGCLIMGQAVEECKLHERISLKILLFIGTDLQWLLLGVMLSTMFLSMWMMNTVTTTMMIPIVEELLKKINASSNKSTGRAKVTAETQTSLTESKYIDDPENDEYSEDEHQWQNDSPIRIAFLLSICYSANIGGTGTLTGTGSNFLMKGLMEEHFPKSDDINFASWMIYSVPGMLICTLIAWFYLWKVYLRKLKYSPKVKQDLLETISKRYKELGSFSYCEKVVMTLFAILMLLWMTRDPKIVKGWGTLVGFDKKVGDAVPAIAVSFFLFFLPSNPQKIESGPIMNFKKVLGKIPWGVIIIFGGGYSLADAVQKSGLSSVIERHMTLMEVLPSSLIVASVCFITAMTTEVLSNLTTTIIFFPIISRMAVALKINPLYLLLPKVCASSYAFMLPVGTAPNALVFAAGNMRTWHMAKPGIFMNVLCVAVQLLTINSLGSLLFDVHNFPKWADSTDILNPLIPITETLLNNATKF